MSLKFTVSIVTINRYKLLKNCLNSIKTGNILPDKVLIVDNSKIHSLPKYFDKVLDGLNYKYLYETKRGESYARNKVLNNVNKGVIVFIDDDCIANKNWLLNINKHFKKYPESVGVLGISKNYFNNNIYACIGQCYYIKWLMENFKNVQKTQVMDSKNNFFDTKNLAIKKDFLKNFSFDSDILFNSINCDTIAGKKLLQSKKIFFDPNIIVHHNNPNTLIKLIYKNFLQGISDQLILDKNNINMKITKEKISYNQWFNKCFEEILKLSFINKIFFWILLFLYPLPYRLGRLSYKLGITKIIK